MIIGTFAYCGSGQDTLADSICQYYDYTKYSMGDLFIEIAEQRGLDKSRHTLRAIRFEYDQKYGRSYFPRLLIERIQKSGKKNIIITGIRTIEEYEMLKKELKIKLLFVYADKEIRYERMIKRCNEKDEKNIELLMKQMEIEKETFDYELLKKHADFKFCFNMTMEEYKKKELSEIKHIINCIGE